MINRLTVIVLLALVTAVVAAAPPPLPVLPASAAGQARVETGTNVGANEVRIALPEFQAKTNDPNLARYTALFNQVLWDDLDYSGNIALISKSFYPSGKFQSPTDIRIEDW